MMKLDKILVLVLLFALAVPKGIERVECHYAWLSVEPRLVMQGGEFRIRYNLSKFFTLPTGGVVVAKRRVREINISVEVPPGLICAIEGLEVTGNGTITREVKGQIARVKAGEDIGTLKLLAKVKVPLDYKEGIYEVRVRAIAREVDQEGNEVFVDYSTSENVEIRTFGPIFSIRAQPEKVEPPQAVGVIVTIIHDEPVPPINITNLTLRVIPPPPNEPQVIPLVDIFGRSFLVPGRSIRFPRPIYVEIGEETPGGVKEIRAILEFWVLGRKKVIETSTNVTILKETELNLSAQVPSEASNGSSLNIRLEVTNVGSFKARRVIVLGEIGGSKSVVEVGDINAGEYKVIEMSLPVFGAGNETLRISVYWNNEYPPEQVRKSFEFTVFVRKSGLNLTPILALTLLIVLIGWFVGKKAVKRISSS